MARRGAFRLSPSVVDERRHHPSIVEPMTTRTTTKSVTFAHPFALGELEEVLPPGVYVVETDEELIEGVDFIAYRRIAIEFHLPSTSANPILTRTITLHPHEFDAALVRDAAFPTGAGPN
jgi:hypothetical protein